MNQKIIKLDNDASIPGVTELDWFKIVHRDNSPLFASFIRRGSIFQNPEFEFDNTIKRQAILFMDAYAVQDDYQKLISIFINKARKDNDFLNRYFKSVESDHNRLINFAKENGQKDWQSVSLDQLAEEFNVFVELVLNLTSHMWPPLAPEDWLVDEIKGILLQQINDEGAVKRDLHNLIAPEETSIMQDKKVEILQLAAGIKKDEKEIYEKYAWIMDDKLKLEYEDFLDFQELVVQAKLEDSGDQLAKIKEEKQEVLQLKEGLIKKYSLDERAVQLCSQASSLPYVRNLRREGSPHAMFLMKEYFEVVRKKLDVKSLTDLFHWEIIEALTGKKIDLKNIKDRKGGFGLMFVNDNLYVMNGERAKQLKQIIIKEQDRVDQIKGQTACFGKVIGIARVLKSSTEIDRIQPGDILITAMTTPDFVPAMKAAAAVVTDEGGISCHAAIVSREMKKPCVIGTKVATQVIKDGSMIEVDANEGIVRVL